MKILAIRGKKPRLVSRGIYNRFLQPNHYLLPEYSQLPELQALANRLYSMHYVWLYSIKLPAPKAVRTVYRFLIPKDKVSDKKDPRSILRRGTTHGYAEVDFKALNGLCYRSSWSVARARDKITGKLKNAEIRVFRLDNQEEIQGTKRDSVSYSRTARHEFRTIYSIGTISSK